ncbi:MAG TPA: CoA transferase [Steroidobacteraceae bacterium]|nr:CoA transferase [Steroidobacteraceae bacterium]
MKVVDLSRGIAGGYCAGLLALIGAEVVRLAPPGDALPEAGEDAGIVRAYLHRGKTLLTEDFDSAQGRQRLLKLIAGADALIEDLGPGGLEAWGLEERALRERRPELVLTRISEFGSSGPWAGWAGSELINLAAGGMLFLTGSWERPPVALAPCQAQLTAGLLAAIASAAALYGGGPATIDFSKQEAIAALITPALSEWVYAGTIPEREGKVSAMARIERSKDGWIYAGPGAAATADYARYSAFLGIPELGEERFATPAGRMEHWQEHQALLQPRLAEKTTAEWLAAAAEARLTFGPVQTTADLLDCEVLAERGFFAELATPSGPARAPRAPWVVTSEV